MKWPFRKRDSRPAWDEASAEKLLGATVLVGMTYREPGGDRLDQVFGTVTHVEPERGITLRLEGSRAGEVFNLPPDLGALSPARPGEYRLRQTGEVVVDPDFTTTWNQTPPPH